MLDQFTITNDWKLEMIWLKCILYQRAVCARKLAGHKQKNWRRGGAVSSAVQTLCLYVCLKLMFKVMMFVEFYYHNGCCRCDINSILILT